MGKNQLFAAIIFLFLANVLGGIAVYDLTQPVSLKVIFFDIGQGDAILVKTPLGHKILIDGGPDSAVLEKLGRHVPFWDRQLDAVVVTHLDHDHLGGIIEVLKSYQVKTVMLPESSKNNAEIKEWGKIINTKHINVKYGAVGNKIVSGDALVTILYPEKKTTADKKANANNDAIVAKLSFKSNEYLFTSDIGGAIEKKIVKAGSNLKSSILKVSHHGSASSTTNELLEAVRPLVAVISVGKNNYGQPNEVVFKRLANYGIKVLRTDNQGDIVTLGNGDKIKVVAER